MSCRFQSQYSQHKKLSEKSELHFNYIQSEDVGRTHDVQLRSNTASQLQPTSVPQYCLYDANSSDVI